MLLTVVLLGAGALYRFGRSVWHPVYVALVGGRTVQQAVDQYAGDAEPRLRPSFDEAGVAYPPGAITLIAFKQEKRLELWAVNGVDQTDWRRIRDYAVLAASGTAGPKLRESDYQVPEGVYRIESLNPNSSYHLSMKLDYPNAFDLERARDDGRDDPGSNIFIHGKAASVGCLAMGDEAIEELFVLVGRVGIENVKVLILPHDPRDRPLQPIDDGLPDWTAELYNELERRARDLIAEGKASRP